MAAVFIRIAEAEDAGFGGLLVQRGGEFAAFLPPVDLGKSMGLHEAADGGNDRLMGFIFERRAGAPLIEALRGGAHGVCGIFGGWGIWLLWGDGNLLKGGFWAGGGQAAFTIRFADSCRCYRRWAHGGCRLRYDRRVISGIIFVIRDGLRWRDTPADYGPHKTIYNSFIRWSRMGVPWSADARLQQVVSRLALTPVRIRLAPDMASFAFAKRPMVLLGDLPVMTVFERPISGMDAVLKRAEDLVLTMLIMLVAAPVMALTALAVKLDSPGPVLFRQLREGFNNKPFEVLKFRSMYVDHGQRENIEQASRHDPRVTPVGRFIRRTSIDELPQLLNVLKGDMSLVGPRPHAPSTRAGDRLFSEVVASYAARHKVKPGITGWAQVCGWRGETDTEAKLVKRLEHDLHYIENWSLGFDIYILVRTLGAVVLNRDVF